MVSAELAAGGPALQDVVLMKGLAALQLEEEPVSSTGNIADGSSLVPCAVSSFSISSLCSEEPFCRICHEGGGVEVLLSPCHCAGSLAMVHRRCLERWLSASNSDRCELCHFQFSLERLPKPLSEWLETPSAQHQRRTLCGDAVCFTFITPLASLSGWLCVRGALDLYYSNSVEAVGLIVLTLALFTIYLFWTAVSLRYHLHLFKTWRKTNQMVRLQVPRSEGPPSSGQILPLHLSEEHKGWNKEIAV